MKAWSTPPECVDRLLDEIRKSDGEEPPESEHALENNSNRNRYRPLPTRHGLGKLLDVALAASQQPEEGTFPRFSLAYVSPDGLVERRYDVCPFAETKVMLKLPDGTKLTKEGPSKPGVIESASIEKDYRGMRHRSAAQFCANQPGQALALVVSQDGDVTLVARRDDGTVHKMGPYASGIGVAM